MKKLYIRDGRKFICISERNDFTLPSDGIWSVRIEPGVKSASQIQKISDLPIPLDYVQLQIRKDQIASAVREFTDLQGDMLNNKGRCAWSHYDFAEFLIKKLSDYEKSKKKREGYKFLLIEKYSQKELKKTYIY